VIPLSANDNAVYFARGGVTEERLRKYSNKEFDEAQCAVHVMAMTGI
jgi:hypothetical protein